MMLMVYIGAYVRYELSPNYVPVSFASKSGGHVFQLMGVPPINITSNSNEAYM